MPKKANLITITVNFPLQKRILSLSIDDSASVLELKRQMEPLVFVCSKYIFKFSITTAVIDLFDLISKKAYPSNRFLVFFMDKYRSMLRLKP